MGLPILSGVGNRMSGFGGPPQIRAVGCLLVAANNGHSLSCNQTLAVIQTRPFETVQERLGILKAQSVNALGVLPVHCAWWSGVVTISGNG
jgi:hypothetical protein